MSEGVPYVPKKGLHTVQEISKRRISHQHVDDDVALGLENSHKLLHGNDALLNGRFSGQRQRQATFGGIERALIIPFHTSKWQGRKCGAS